MATWVWLGVLTPMCGRLISTFDGGGLRSVEVWRRGVDFLSLSADDGGIFGFA